MFLVTNIKYYNVLSSSMSFIHILWLYSAALPCTPMGHVTYTSCDFDLFALIAYFLHNLLNATSLIFNKFQASASLSTIYFSTVSHIHADIYFHFSELALTYDKKLKLVCILL